MATYHVFYRRFEYIQKDPMFAYNVKEGDTVIRTHYDFVTTLEAECLGEVFQKMNIVDGDELPVKLKVRSMMPGDFIMEGKTTYGESGTLCAPVGWVKVRVQQ